ncbi:hypothetical protein ACS0TY_008738 [Phlomoides rotata]
MDGYNQYSWNQVYTQNGVIFPPQYGDFSYDNGRSYNYNYQMPQVPSYYQDWRSNEDRSYASLSNNFQPQQEFEPSISSSPKGKTSIDEMVTLILKKMGSTDEGLALIFKNMEEKYLKMVFKKIQDEEEKGEEEDERSEDDPSEWNNEDGTLFIEEDQEECSLMNMNNKEQESQETSKEELKNKMSISKPLNSSIYALCDDYASFDYILPLDSFYRNEEIEKSLGIHEQKGGEWKDMLRNYVEEELITNGMGDRFTLHASLLPFEAQRLRYNGKEDRYPWPFR